MASSEVMHAIRSDCHRDNTQDNIIFVHIFMGAKDI